VPRIELYTTDRCSFCARARGLLEDKGVTFEEIYLPREDLDAHIALARRTGMVTMPQVVVDDRILGGWDTLVRLESDGRLEAALTGSPV
jgi:glutaredoxin 3